jgi:hypothetical protein
MHGKTNSFAVNFPSVSFWQRVAMFHFNPKISIEVCLRHNQAIPLYGDKFIKACTEYVDLCLNLFLSNIAHTHATFDLGKARCRFHGTGRLAACFSAACRRPSLNACQAEQPGRHPVDNKARKNDQ